MRIVVCIKQVPGTTTVEIDEVTGVLKRDGTDSKMNPYDLYAIETAVQIKNICGGTVLALTMGPGQATEILEEALMMGADDGVILSDRAFAGADVLATAYTLAQGIKAIGEADLVICGKQTTDGDTAQVGAELAAVLGWPLLHNVRKFIEIKNDELISEVDWPQAEAELAVKLPCVMTVEKDIFTPRLPSYKRKLQYREHQLRVLALDDLIDKNDKKYGLNGSPTRVARIFPPESNNVRDLWRGSSEELVDRLFALLKQRKVV